MSTVSLDRVRAEAEALLDDERYQAAILHYRRITPPDAHVYSGMAAAYAGLAEFDKAQQASREALSREAHEARALAVAGYLADVVEGTPQRAVDLAQAAVQADPRSAYARYRLGTLLLKYEHFDEAREQLLAARELNPTNWRVALALSRFAPTGRERTQQAQAAYRAGWQRNRGDLRIGLGLLRTFLAVPFTTTLGRTALPSTALARHQNLALQALFNRPFQPFLTYTILAINTLMMIVLETHGGSENTATLLWFGAKDGSLIQAGQWWRLLTPMVLHAGWLHWGMNSLFLWVMGPLVERLFGRPRMLFLYIFAGVCGNFASYLHDPSALSVGASTALFGLLGALAVFFWRARALLGSFGQRQFQGIVVTAVLNLLINLTIPEFDMFGHIGGLIGGIVVGFAIMPHYALQESAARTALDDSSRAPSLQDQSPRRATVAAAALVAAVLVTVIYFTIYV